MKSEFVSIVFINIFKAVATDLDCKQTFCLSLCKKHMETINRTAVF